MLYITTRDNTDAFTAHHALTEDYAQDGGRYIPFRFPQFSADDLHTLTEKPFGQIIAEILNTFFSSRLTGWDVDFCIGRNAARTIAVAHKTAVAELWHNPQSDYGYIVDSLYNLVTGQNASSGHASEWFQIAVRIAVMFALYGEIVRQQIISDQETFDISVPVNDFSAPMAAYYARTMGLPVQKILCSDQENSCVWDFIQRGTLSTSTIDDALYPGAERLIQATLGFGSVHMFREKYHRRQIFAIDEAQHGCITDAFFCSVIGTDRIRSVICSIFRSNSYIFDPGTALCHGGLQDYRAKTGNSRTTLIFAVESPLRASEQICSAIGVDAEKLTDLIKNS